MTEKVVLRGLSEIRQHFFRDPTPIYYVCDMSYYLMGIDEWVRGFRYINMSDCFDGTHPHVLVPKQRPPYFDFPSLEAINTHLLEDEEVRAAIRARGPGKVVFLLFDERAVELAKGLDLEVILPPLAVRREADGKVSATRIGDRAGVPSVPNVLGRIDSYEALREVAGHLGPDVVIQTPFGDSGTTTYFVSSEADWAKCAAEVAKEPEVKVMKRIRCRASAQEACVTRQGTVVGPLMTEIVGFPELTPYKGGWAGNEVTADAFPASVRNAAREKTFRVGEELRKIGYRGYFEIDYLTDLDTGELYMGEINPRITGASGMTNLAAFAHADAPLFLFHLLEFSDVEFELDVAELNRRWSDPKNIDDWSQLVIKFTEDRQARTVAAPRTGVWRLDEDGAKFERLQTHRRTVDDEQHAFFLRHMTVGEELCKGMDLGILVTRGRLMTDDYQLTERARRWIAEIRAQFRFEDVPQ
ncbi:MAG: biotin carboxylase [Planctomycetota bacterium]